MNARLRRVVVDKDELIAAREALLASERELRSNQDLLLGQLREQVDTQDALVKVQGVLIDDLRAEVVQLERQLGWDSSNSSIPPSRDFPAAKGKRRAQCSQRVRSKDRKPGGGRDIWGRG